MQKWTLQEIIEHARIHSPYYRSLYKSTTSDRLNELPAIDQATFWNGQVLTDKPHGIVYKSGGSTGAPKYSFFTNEEWKAFTTAFGMGMSEGILSDGDRVANLFYSGDLYASFLFIKDSLNAIPESKCRLAQFPIAGQTDHIQILKTIEEFNINVIVGVPSAILSMLEKYTVDKTKYPKIKIERILFGGESLYDDQRKTLMEIFPGIQISSIGCASVDGGLIGYSSKDCSNGEHRVFDGANIIEIVDPDTMRVITEKGVLGKVLLTNLTRKLMPIIRYPAGDMAMWVEDEGTPDRKFILQGRSEEAARLGTISVYFEDTREMIANALPDAQGIQFQLIVNHFDQKDEMIIKVGSINLLSNEQVVKKVYDAFLKDKPTYNDILKKNLIHPLKIEYIAINQLEANTRTGKLKRIIDLRK
jgi:phenylacetate-CoA ligase